MKERIEEIDEAELAIFKKKLKKLALFKGKGTEMISLYVPPDADRGTVMGQITEELSQSSNIKSPTTKKNVQGALRKVNNFLKQIDFKIPPAGLVVFCGNISEQEGKSNIQLFTVKPPQRLKTKLYWCDSQFHLTPLQEMAEPKDLFGIVTIDKNESTIAILIGKKYEILGRFTSGVSGKSRAGGQSAKRFEHLREEATQDFYKRISEKLNMIFLPYGDKLRGLIVSGPGITKNYFLNKELIDHRLSKKILGTLDISYTDESGIAETVQKSDELLKDAEIIKEKTLMSKFLEHIVKTGLAAYGEKEVNEALEMGRVETLMLSEGLEWMVYKFKCNQCNEEDEIIVKNPLEFEESKMRCKKCNAQPELVEEVDYADYMIERAKAKGSQTKIVSTDTPEGEQFFKGFGGIGAILRY